MLSTPGELRKIGVDSQDESLQRRTRELNLISCDTRSKSSLILYDIA